MCSDVISEPGAEAQGPARSAAHLASDRSARLRRFEEEHAAVRRVATLVATQAPASELFAAVVEEVVRLLNVPGGWLFRYDPGPSVFVLASSNVPGYEVGSRYPLDGPSVSAMVLDTGRPARIDDYRVMGGTIASRASDSGFRSGLGVPVTVDGSLWGVLSAGATSDARLPDDTEARLREFTELVGAAISNREARDGLRRLADEQTALRRLATLVVEGAPADVLFSAVGHAVTEILETSAVTLWRYEPDRSVTVLAAVSGAMFPVGSRWPLDGSSVVATVFETGRPARIDDYSKVSGTIADATRETGFHSVVGAPITVEGRVWGLITTAAKEGEPLPPDTAARLRDFTELVATAIYNMQARDGLQALADEQAARRRIATLVAEGVPASELFAAVGHEVAQVLGLPAVMVFRYDPDRSITVVARESGNREELFPVGTRWPLDGPTVAAQVFDTGRPARIDDYHSVSGTIAARIRGSRYRSVVGVPITVDGRVWGLITTASEQEPLPPETADRLHDFTELVATAISNMQARDDLHALAEEQAALRRVATLVAEGTSSEDLFATVCEEAGRLLRVPAVAVERYDADDHTTVLASWGDVDSWSGAGFVVGSRWPLDGPSVARAVLDTGRPAMIDDYSGLPGTIAAMVRAAPDATWVGVPITVEGATWGVIYACSTGRPISALPPDIEAHLARFTDLVAIAVANAQAREALRDLADEQAALRRLATLVAQGTSTEEVFDAVCDEAGRLLDVPTITLERHDPDDTLTLLAAWGETRVWADAGFVVGSRWPLKERAVSQMLLESGRPTLIADYSKVPGAITQLTHSAPNIALAGVPITVEGKTWGVIWAATTDSLRRKLPDNIEWRLARFSEMVAIAVANAQARGELRGLVEEQTALQRIATLVARGAESQIVFDAICVETQHLVGATSVNLAHFTGDGFYVAIAGSSLRDTHIHPGTRLPLGMDSISGIVRRTAAPARIDSYEDATGELAKLVRERGIRSTVAAPILVEGRLWGAVIAGKDSSPTFPAGVEDRVARFAELAATAISSATTRSELIASRARIVAAGDAARRRIERNLHDGVQQRLIALGLDLRAVGERLPPGLPEPQAGLIRLQREVETVLEDVRELSRGLHPALLSRGGLGASLAALARKSPIPVRLEMQTSERAPEPVEVAIYYVVSEALANAARHSGASEVLVTVDKAGPNMIATIQDDGLGGADTSGGSGISGLIDRVEALGGRLALDSPPGRGTRISVSFAAGPASAGAPATAAQ